MLSNQEVLNRAINYHYVQGKPPGYDLESEQCSYVKGCAIGCQLSKEALEGILYHTVDGASIGYVIEKVPKVAEELEGATIGFLKEIQAAHDYGAGRDMFITQDDDIKPAEWETKRAPMDMEVKDIIYNNYVIVARAHGLTITLPS